MEILQQQSLNGILASLSAQDFATLRRYLMPVLLPTRKALEAKNKKIEYVYFIEHGLASVVATAESDHSVEIGVIGREGMTGLSLIMGVDIAPHAVFMQSPGSGFRMAASDLRQVLDDSGTLCEVLLRYCHTMTVQMGYTALANGRYKIDERLARWLLMAQDRADSDTINLTHEFLSMMLGCRRPSVTPVPQRAGKKRSDRDSTRHHFGARPRGSGRGRKRLLWCAGSRISAALSRRVVVGDRGLGFP